MKRIILSFFHVSCQSTYGQIIQTICRTAKISLRIMKDMVRMMIYDTRMIRSEEEIGRGNHDQTIQLINQFVLISGIISIGSAGVIGTVNENGTLDNSKLLFISYYSTYL